MITNRCFSYLIHASRQLSLHYSWLIEGVGVMNVFLILEFVSLRHRMVAEGYKK